MAFLTARSSMSFSQLASPLEAKCASTVEPRIGAISQQLTLALLQVVQAFRHD